jgi:tyrosine-protein kinase Etk/Wzc
MELANLERDISVHDRNYRTYVEKGQDAQANDELNRQKSANIAVIQKATAPTKPVRPNKPLNLALGVILGALAGLGLALAREVLAQGLATPHSAEKRLGLPVLTTIALKH